MLSRQATEQSGWADTDGEGTQVDARSGHKREHETRVALTFHTATANISTATATGAFRSLTHGRPASETMTQIRRVVSYDTPNKAE